ncbi:MAG: HAD-IA family hydrolase, partial [Bacteroidetes bacterium]|nr:HAD-IA family hydrolase [Bacteroidota bacterium]
EDVGYKKPDPQIFSIATSRLGVLPTEVILIGDDLEADIIGARNSGWNAIHFDKEGEFNHKHCPIVNCLSEIKKYL